MNKPSASRFAHLQAQNYSIEDKTHMWVIRPLVLFMERGRRRGR
jgi:hypothetical protein